MFTVDIHSHILPGIDDGAADPDVSMDLLREESAQGLKHIVLTPHFHPRDEEIGELLRRRSIAYEQLKQKIAGSELEDQFDIRLAAEIRYSPRMTEMRDLEKLRISGTNVLLIEFSFTHYPEFVRDVFYRLQLQGFTILIAHIERYSWLRQDTELLYDLVCSGAYAQVNAESIVGDRDYSSYIRKMFNCGLVHVVGSDTHDMEKRPPRMKAAAGALTTDPGPDSVSYMNRIAEGLLAGQAPYTEQPSMPKKSFWDRFRR